MWFLQLEKHHPQQQLMLMTTHPLILREGIPQHPLHCCETRALLESVVREHPSVHEVYFQSPQPLLQSHPLQHRTRGTCHLPCVHLT